MAAMVGGGGNFAGCGGYAAGLDTTFITMGAALTGAASFRALARAGPGKRPVPTDWTSIMMRRPHALSACRIGKAPPPEPCGPAPSAAPYASHSPAVRK